MSDSQYKFATRAIHAGEGTDPATGAHNTPIYQTSTYTFHSVEDKLAILAGEQDGYFYTRLANPTTDAFEAKVADLEGAEAAIAASSGMGAIMATIRAFVRAGDHIVSSDDVYHYATVYMNEEAAKDKVEVTRVDITDLDAVRGALRPETKMIYTEFISNPGIKIADLEALAGIAREAGVMLVVDNTFASPYLVRPLELGADIVIHSATKYLCGHGDTLAGIACGRKELIDQIEQQVIILGSCISPFNSWLLLRGIKTLDLRMARHCANAMAVAQFLEQQPDVVEVRYPGLESHPSHAIAKRLMPNGFGGMISFRHRAGTDGANQFANALKLCDHAVSLGDVNTLVWPHNEQLTRVSVGCEAEEDIIADFEQALEAVSAMHLAVAD